MCKYISKTASDHLHLIWSNPVTGEHYEWVDSLPVTIGRAASLNEIVLNNKQVSRQHARLEGGFGKKIILIDQDSTNGTLVGGQKVKQATLDDVDSFQIGPFTFVSVNCCSEQARQ